MGNPSQQVLLPHASSMSHNLINKEMMNVDDLTDIDEGDSAYATIAGDDIHYIKNSNVDQMAG
ncbi:putative nuclease HARBI1 [Cucumis melo var. makuwa]|uniref:Nuclease HARBI1 n=1 Tax=Cucumis melo var. makuwa TaxID=1194695 RepID=A0A5A7T1X3_CUCMM|nr:putative nuclease HARBI1 [Cucumis melo var. makuwa]TYK30925.1 putative nuclease HARBI1 [Cucumis melo var. makuwa]